MGTQQQRGLGSAALINAINNSVESAVELTPLTQKVQEAQTQKSPRLCGGMGSTRRKKPRLSGVCTARLYAALRRGAVLGAALAGAAFFAVAAFHATTNCSG